MGQQEYMWSPLLKTAKHFFWGLASGRARGRACTTVLCSKEVTVSHKLQVLRYGGVA